MTATCPLVHPWLHRAVGGSCSTRQLHRAVGGSSTETVAFVSCDDVVYSWYQKHCGYIVLSLWPFSSILTLAEHGVSVSAMNFAYRCHAVTVGSMLLCGTFDASCTRSTSVLSMLFCDCYCFCILSNDDVGFKV